MIDGGTLTGSASTVVGLLNGELEVFRSGPISIERLTTTWQSLRQS